MVAFAMAQSVFPLTCLVAHLQAKMEAHTFITVIHAGNSDYLRLLHDLAAQLLVKKHHVYIFDYRRRVKLVYLQQVLRKITPSLTKVQRYLHLKVILDESHALNEYQRLQRVRPSMRRTPVFILVDPSGLFGRLIGSVKQAAEALQFQYEAAQLLAAKGFAVMVIDAGGREFHRTDSLIPAQLVNSSSLIVQFLPQQIIID